MMTPPKWVLILGASSGFGAASARGFAAEGYNVLGVHLDRRSTMDKVRALQVDVENMGREIHMFNGNAASDDFRTSVLEQIGEILRANDGHLHVVLHSLAFGTLTSLIPTEGLRGVTRKQLEMTLDVMANSLVYWVRDLVAAECLHDARVFAMTSEGSEAAWPKYGPVAAAKSALESYIRQLSRELAPHRVTVNGIMAGVTQTPALSKIPGNEQLIEKALSKNPYNRLTRPEDVAAALVNLANTGTHWINSNIIRIDGGESSCA
jgi:enoyl-[acyl-carrier protein] reductase III